MSAESKRKLGKKTRAAVKRELRVKPVTPDALAERLELKRSTVYRHLKALVRGGEAAAVRVGRGIGYARAARQVVA